MSDDQQWKPPVFTGRQGAGAQDAGAYGPPQMAPVAPPVGNWAGT